MYFCLLSYLFLQCWGSNQGSCTCQASATSPTRYVRILSTFFVSIVIFLIFCQCSTIILIDFQILKQPCILEINTLIMYSLFVIVELDCFEVFASTFWSSNCLKFSFPIISLSTFFRDLLASLIVFLPVILSDFVCVLFLP